MNQENSMVDLEGSINNAELRSEVLRLLDGAPDGLDSDKLFEKSQLALEKRDVSRAVGTLRSSLDVDVRETGDDPKKKRTFFISDKGRHTLYGTAPKAEKRVSIEKKLPEIAVSKDKAGAPSKPGKLAMVPSKTTHDFRCMLTSDNSLILETHGDAAHPGKKFELNQEQVSVLWDYLAKIYPSLVRMESATGSGEKSTK